MKRKFLLVIIIVLIICIGIYNIIYAADNTCKLELSVVSNYIKPGDYIEVTLKVSDIQAENGIVAVSGVFEYDSSIIDEDIFEDNNIEKIEFSTCNGWKTPDVSSNYLYITTRNLEATANSGDVMKMKIPTKSIIEDGSYNITFKNIEIATDSSSFIINDITAQINIKNTMNDNQGENQGQDKETEQDEKPNQIQNINNTSTSNIANTNISNITLPKAGLSTYIGITLVIVSIVGGISYFKYKKYKSIK